MRTHTKGIGRPGAATGAGPLHFPPAPARRGASARAGGPGRPGFVHELGQLAIAPPRIQRWSAPDMEWLDWTARDAGATAFNAVESLPGFGNSISGLLAAGELGRAGFDSLMGSDKDVAKDLSDAEDEALNAIPIFGNIRAAGRAGQDAAAVSNDFAGVAPENNPTAESDWARGGQQRFNESASRLWHDFLP